METEKKKLYVNTGASKRVKFLRGLSWTLAIGGIVASPFLGALADEEVATGVLIGGITFFIIAIFIKPVYVRTLAAEIEIARAMEEFVFFADPEFKEEIKD